MRSKTIASFLSIILGMILGLSAISSGIGIAKADSVIATISEGSVEPFTIAFDSSNHYLYVTNAGRNTVSIIDGQTNTLVGSPIAVGQEPEGIAFDSSNGDLYIANSGSNTVSVISGQNNTVIGNPITVGGEPLGIAFDSANGNLIVANAAGFVSGSGTVSVISGSSNTVIGSPVRVGSGPNGIAFDSANGNLYVTNFGSGIGTGGNTVSAISGKTNTVVGNPIAVGSGPDAIAFDSADGNLYVTNQNDNTVSVISGSSDTVVGSPITVGHIPVSIAFDSTNHNLYVANYADNTVSVISGVTNTVVGSPITVGHNPERIAFDSVNGHLYVTNIFDNTVSVIAPTHTTTLTLNSIANVPSGTTVTVTGKLTDNNASNAGISGKTISFTGTGAANLGSVTTNPDGTFTATGTAPSTVNNGWTVQAHFAGDSLYGAADSIVQIYNTVRTTPIPPATTVTSAVDGDGVTITNGGTTLSTSIKIAFSATPGTNPIAGFQCSFDNSPFSSCTSPATFNNLAVGPHKFTVVAVDTAGNKDPNPATFGWTISTISPTQSIQQLIQLKHSMHLDPATDRTLDIRLNIALQFAQNNIKSGTCIQLTVFIRQVQGSNGHVTSTQATQLIQGAQNIQTALGCTGNGIVASSPSPLAASSLNQNQSQQPQQQPKSPNTYQYRYPFQIPQAQPSQAQQAAPIANAGVSQAVTENTKVTLDGRTSYAPNGGTIVGYQWTQLPTGVPVVLTGANTATPTFTVPSVPTDTVLAFSLRVMDSHGAVSSNPAIVYVMVKHNPTTGGNTPGTTRIQPHQQPLPNNLLPTPSQPNSRPPNSSPQIGSHYSANRFPSGEP